MAGPTTNRIGGVLNFTIDGTQYAARGNFEVTPSTVKREGIAGQDYVHGYTELPIVPGIKGDLTTTSELSLQTLEQITDSTIQCSLANGKTYVLSQAWTVSAFAISTAEGRCAVEFQGISIDEI